MASLYIHIPFCKKKCPYCGFYSVTKNEAEAAAYVDVITRELEGLKACRMDTVYIGGGTPTSLSVAVLGRLLSFVIPLVTEKTEFTVEANPESVTEEKMRALAEAGVNRISLGVQSFSDQKLKTLGRIHNADSARRALDLIRVEGIKNISIDLMFGVPDETETVWSGDLKEAVSSGVQHISCYAFTVEEGTPFSRMVLERRVRLASDSSQARMYETAVDALQGAGFLRYEVSNFALPGFECRHNINYWDGGEYYGAGASAVSYVGGVRAERVHDVRTYINAGGNGEKTTLSREILPSEKRARETAAFKIRTALGIEFEWFLRTTGYEFNTLLGKDAEELHARQLIESSASGIRLTSKGFLFCDTVSRAFV